MIAGIIVGAIGASILWFFIIRNNRKNFDKAFDALQAKYDEATKKK